MHNTKTQSISICLGSSCFSRGNAENLEVIKKYLDDHNLTSAIDFRGHLCSEKCNRGPVIQFGNDEYENVTPENLPYILKKHFE
ncbi:MAG: (2Fe-2S) ferredoxin domain-containing protein [Marinilabiliaceae bacterium]|nr:(2Fe-2S) ferredoxin domain-containing protein [Marinilabiliaceae bacterium]